MDTFNELPLENGKKDRLIKFLSDQKITKPTKVQAAAFDLAGTETNAFITSQTGSGKTYAFLLPLLCGINDNKELQAIIIVPTEELSVQIYNDAKDLFSTVAEEKVSILMLNGSGNLNRQIEQLKKEKQQIIIGTPGRISQLTELKKIKPHTVKYLIYDEAEKLLEKSYYKDVLFIRKKCMRDIDIWMFSATIPNNVENRLKELSEDFKIIKIASDSKIPDTIEHLYVIEEQKKHTEQIRKILSTKKDRKWMVFASSAYDCEVIYQKLKHHNYNVNKLYGKMTKEERTNSMNQFRDKKIKDNILICTDIGARGIHVPNIYGVINVNVPEEYGEYQHRCGRCGRNNKNGASYFIITKNEEEKIKSISKYFNIDIKKI